MSRSPARVQQTISTRAAPPRLSTRAQARAVAPVVQISSIRIAVLPARWVPASGASAKAPFTALWRAPGPAASGAAGYSWSAQQPRLERQTRRPGKLAADERGLIEAARPDPPAMQRYGHQYGVGTVGQRKKALHLTGHHPRQADASPIFEAMRQSATDLAVAHERSRPFQGRWIGQASAAPYVFTNGLRRQFHAAGAALRVADIVDRLPARTAKAPVALTISPQAGQRGGSA